jgi:hypothetical protein
MGAETIHIMPLNDVVEHQPSIDCPCEVMRDIEVPRLIIHTAFDGRDVDSDVGARLIPIEVN